VIKVVITIKVTKKILPKFTMLWITIHLGINPKNGGNPPKDNKVTKKANLLTGLITFKEKI
jgi:hypothetical protein